MPPFEFTNFSYCPSACCSDFPRNAPPPLSGSITLMSCVSAALANVRHCSSAATTRMTRTPMDPPGSFILFSILWPPALRRRARHFLVGLILFKAGESPRLLIRRAECPPRDRLFNHALVRAELHLGKTRLDVTDHPALLLEGLGGIDHQAAELDDRDVA